MTRKYMTALVAFALCGSMNAQDIYKVETFAGTDLNGTARYVGMGGAMNALGADLSTMGTNPAATGLYRHSDVAFSGSATVQPNGKDFADISKARGSFDQAGFLYSCKFGGENLKYINMGFNYQKRRNLKNYIGLNQIATDNGMSQSWQMRDLAFYGDSWLDLAPGANGANYTTPLTVLGYDTQMIDPIYDEGGKVVGYNPSFADYYNYHRAQWGGVEQYDVNFSMNFQNQIYAGFTFGLYNVDMHSYTEYGELLRDGQGNTAMYNMSNSEALTGNGFDFKLGVILRPIEESPFRIGFSISSPIFFDLTQYSYLYMRSPYPFTDKDGNTYDQTEADVETGDFDYRIRSPWKLNLSMATTIGRTLAIDAEYEVSTTTSSQVRYPDADNDYYYGSLRSTKDDALAEEIDACMKPVHTFRIGAEAVLAKGIYARAGYNYVSSPFKKDAFLNLFTDSPSYYYNTNTDYVNLGAINRVTAGLGVRGKHFYADMAYQFQRQQGDVHAFDGGTDPDDLSAQPQTHLLQGKKVDLDRHNILFTVGYKF